MMNRYTYVDALNDALVILENNADNTTMIEKLTTLRDSFLQKNEKANARRKSKVTSKRNEKKELVLKALTTEWVFANVIANKCGFESSSAIARTVSLLIDEGKAEKTKLKNSEGILKTAYRLKEGSDVE